MPEPTCEITRPNPAGDRRIATKRLGSADRCAGLGIDDRVAEQPDGTGDGFQLSAGYFEDGGGEEPCDTVITRRTSQSLGEEAVIESLLARREAVDHADSYNRTGCD